MNYNILSYVIYGSVTIYIIYWVGKLFHRNGRLFIIRLFHNNVSQADTTNNILLIAYYLFNIGYAVMQFSFWTRLSSPADMIASIAGKTGLLISILSVTHYCNMLLIYILSKKRNHSLTP